jgi:hypothetical protein
MRFAALVGAWVLIWTATSASAGELFAGLGPESIGRELTAVLEGAELGCKQDGNDASVRRCQPLPGALDTLSGAKITSAEALFVDGHLEMVTVYFSDRDFAKVAAYLTQQFGAGEDWSVTVRGGMNMGFKDQIFIWERDDLHAVVQQFDRKIDRASLIYGTPQAMAEVMKRIKATPPGGVRDL